MQVIYYNDEIPKTITKSIFLAGGSLRSNQEGQSWRKDAIQILNDKGYDGVVFCPEYKDGVIDKDFDYDSIIEWEEKFLNVADCILFWVPRDLTVDENGNLKMACLTTNIEFGKWADSGKIVWGAPVEAPKNNYMKYYCDKYHVNINETLTDTLNAAIEFIGPGAKRENGECFVPYFIWKTDSFQSWYKAQTNAGNKLHSAKLLYTFRPGYKNFVFLYVLKVHVFIASENRYKTNEFVLSRPDISSILLWKKGTTIEDSEVVIVKEFRSPASTNDGFIRELVGGSSKTSQYPEEVAAEEILEETGFAVNSKRLKYHQSRQLCGTLSSHKSHFYSVELTEEEMTWFKAQNGIVHGVESDTERTFIEVYSIKDILLNNNIDWSCLGMIFIAWNR